MNKKSLTIIGILVLVIGGILVLIIGGAGLLGKSIAKKKAVLDYSNNLTTERDKVVEKLDSYSYTIDNAETFAELEDSYNTLETQINDFKKYFNDTEVPEGAENIKNEGDNYVEILDKILVSGKKFTEVMETEEVYMLTLEEYNDLISDMNEVNDRLNKLAEEITGLKSE